MFRRSWFLVVLLVLLLACLASPCLPRRHTPPPRLAVHCKVSSKFLYLRYKTSVDEDATAWIIQGEHRRFERRPFVRKLVANGRNYSCIVHVVSSTDGLLLLAYTGTDRFVFYSFRWGFVLGFSWDTGQPHCPLSRRKIGGINGKIVLYKPNIRTILKLTPRVRAD
jgi:hypothetical protein